MFSLIFLSVAAFELRGQEILQEKIFVHTDKQYYHTGEVIWFSVYNVEGKSNRPVDVSKIAYIEILDNGNKPMIQGKVKLQKGRGAGSFFIPSSFITGRYWLRAYTRWMKNFSSSAFFEKELAIINPPTNKSSFTFVCDSIKKNDFANQLNIGIAADKVLYHTREKIILSLLSLNGGKPLPAGLSLSVYRLDSLVAVDPMDMNENLQSVPAISPANNFPYAPEFNGHFITGTVINKLTRMPVKGVDAYLNLPGDPNSFHNCKSDSLGRIRFEIKYLAATDSVIVQLNPLFYSNYSVTLDDPFSNSYAPHQPSCFTTAVNNPQTLLKESINAQVEQSFHDMQNNFIQYSPDTIPFYLKGDMHYNLDDFVRFTRLEEVFREYVRPVSVNRKGGSFHLAVSNDPIRGVFHDDPLLLVDGYALFSTDRLFTYDPLKIKSIDVVSQKYYRGSGIFEGVVSLSSYTGMLDRQLVDSTVNVLKYEGLQKQRNFYSPQYETSAAINSHIPDFRNTLYWNPSVNTGSDGRETISFYSSDLEGRFVAIVHGITETGLCGTSRLTFEVKK